MGVGVGVQGLDRNKELQSTQIRFLPGAAQSSILRLMTSAEPFLPREKFAAGQRAAVLFHCDAQGAATGSLEAGPQGRAPPGAQEMSNG